MPNVPNFDHTFRATPALSSFRARAGVVGVSGFPAWDKTKTLCIRFSSRFCLLTCSQDRKLVFALRRCNSGIVLRENVALKGSAGVVQTREASERPCSLNRDCSIYPIEPSSQCLRCDP